ncbi:hypothetical protein TNIN_333091 [Trichonephila inaurata madagascariensis]|uniref:Uncharacterized protein n=1 Tax=Trichonephila inaurata madagascariensis TaxID=2747483 RepID=A0A8X6ME85_9ARAC|nr:hypothetical protein TNIN_333091 [Trichonephila inaurata madagascariensis]
MQLSLSENNCVLWSIWYPHSLERCEPANERELLVSYIKQCVPKCKPACLEYIMDTKKNEFAPRDSHNCETGMDMLQNIFPPVSYYVLRFHPAIETIYETRPKYEVSILDPVLEMSFVNQSNIL